MRFRLRCHNYPYSDNPLSVWYVHSLAAPALLAIGKRAWSHKTRNIWKNGRKLLQKCIGCYVQELVAEMDVMRQGLRLYQHWARHTHNYFSISIAPHTNILRTLSFVSSWRNENHIFLIFFLSFNSKVKEILIFLWMIGVTRDITHDLLTR